MRMIRGIAVVLALTASDYSWIPDFDLASQSTRAEAEAKRLDGVAAQSETLRTQVLAQKTSAEEEKGRLAPTIATLSRVQRGLAESRIRELDEIIAARTTRGTRLGTEVGQARTAAAERRVFAAGVRQELIARQKEEQALRLTDDDSLAKGSDAKLEAARKYHEKRRGRVKFQIAALDRVLDDPGSGPETVAAAIEGKSRVRASTGDDEIWLTRIEEELRIRTESRAEEKQLASELLVAAKPRETVEPIATPSDRGKAADAWLDQKLREQDAAKAAELKRPRTIRKVVRLSVLFLALGGGAGLLWLILKRGMA